MADKKRIRKKRSVKEERQFSLLAHVADEKMARDELKGLLMVDIEKDQWRGVMAVPPDTMLETVISAFKTQTDIPLELPFFSTLSFISAHLLKSGAIIDFKGQEIRPDLWTVILASSGAGKTFASSRLKSITGIHDYFPEPVSGAAFVSAMSEYNNELWIRDEFGQFLKLLETTQYAEIKDYLLRVYDGDLIERKTKSETISINNPALVIQGMSVLETFGECLGGESLLDGFAQRFSYVIAQSDDKRKPEDFPWYDLSDWSDDISKQWESLVARPVHSQFIIGDGAEEAFTKSFRMLIGNAVPISFFRRVMYRAIKYSLIYHYLIGDDSNVITRTDMSWAARVSYMHLQDAAELLKTHVASDLERIIRASEKVRDRFQEQCKPLTPRDIVHNVRGIRTVTEAKGVLEMIQMTM